MTEWVLDLYCCAGGATRGYQMAGYQVLGVDVVERPNYCGDDFVQMDALSFLHLSQTSWAFIHSSPPCQEASTLTQGTNMSQGWGREHIQWVPATRKALDVTGTPYLIEQPQGSNIIRRDLRLCMDMFPITEPPWVMRHRDFEISGITVPQPRHTRHRGRVRGWRHGVLYDGPYVAAYGSGGGKASVAEMQHALGIGWTSEREELTEAIPPAYTEYIGRYIGG